jgi:nucleolin
LDVWKSLPNFTATFYIKHFTMIQDILSNMSVNEAGELVNRLQPKQVNLLQEVAIESPETAAEKAWGVWSVKAARKKAGEDEPDDDDDGDVPAEEEEEEDDWEKGEEGEEEADEWDPDFDEFDIPKPTKKAAGGKKDSDEEEDVKFDEDLNEFDDLFGGSGDNFDDDDDF